MYMLVKCVPKTVTVAEMNNFLSTLLQCRIKGEGFEPTSIGPKNKTFFFKRPYHMPDVQVIKIIKGKFIGGQRVRIYTCNAAELKQLKTWKNNAEIFSRANQNVQLNFNKNKQNETQNMIILKTCRALFTELFDRYPGLEEASDKSSNVLGYEIFSELKKRVTTIIDNTQATDHVEGTTKYRDVHPHSTDFALVKECHKKCEETPLPPEEELAIDMLANEEYFPCLTMTPTALHRAREYYTTHLNIQLNKHIMALDTDMSESPSLEERATALARTHIRLTVYKDILEKIVDNWMRNFLKLNIIIRVYGMPHLPDLENLTWLLKLKGVISPKPHGDRVYPSNCAVFSAQTVNMKELLGMSGSTVHGCTILVRIAVDERSERQDRRFFAIDKLLQVTADPADSDEWEDL